MVVHNIHSEELIKYIFYVLNFTAVLLPNSFKVPFHGVFVFPSPRPFVWPRLWPRSPTLAPNLLLTTLASNLFLPALALNLYLAVLVANLYLLALASNLLLTSSGQDFTTTTAATCTITTTTITTTTTTTATSTTRDNNNKRCLRGSKIHIKWPLKDIWWKSQVLFQ